MKPSIWNRPMTVSPKWERVAVSFCALLLCWWLGTELAELIENPLAMYIGLGWGIVLAAVLWLSMKPKKKEGEAAPAPERPPE